MEAAMWGLGCKDITPVLENEMETKMEDELGMSGWRG